MDVHVYKIIELNGSSRKSIEDAISNAISRAAKARIGQRRLAHPRRDAILAARRTVMSIENTDLERRVLAHEQILQVLIAHMAEAEPKFLDRLEQIFTQQHTLGANEQDYTDNGGIRRAVYPASGAPEQRAPQLAGEEASAPNPNFGPFAPTNSLPVG
jgi:hypothetical protein